MAKCLPFAKFKFYHNKAYFSVAILWFLIFCILCFSKCNTYISRTSNIAFLTDSAETVDLDFGLIHQNISFKKASFHY